MEHATAIRAVILDLDRVRPDAEARKLERELPGIDDSAHAASGEVAENKDTYSARSTGRLTRYLRLRELMRYLTVHGIPIAATTSSRRVVGEAILADIGLRRDVGLVIGCDDVSRPGAGHDRYVAAARRLGVDLSESLVCGEMRGDSIAAPPAGVSFVGGLDGFELSDIARAFRLAREFDSEMVGRFQAVVRDFFSHAARPMPWRETDDPYRILVSEFMLQQTQVARVLPKYAAFIEHYPDVRSLARASLADVLTLWQGLGYNRRGRNLLEAARYVHAHFGGAIPGDPELLQKLPGVGTYTAAAVAAFAFERPVVVLETNIRRLFIHYFRQLEDDVADRSIEPLIRATLPREGVREWYYALMDYGSFLGRVFANANRRSRHYTRQSAFAGSVREVRGRIVRALTASSGELSVIDLERAIGPTDDRFLPALEGLERDGLVRREPGRVALR